MGGARDRSWRIIRRLDGSISSALTCGESIDFSWGFLIYQDATKKCYLIPPGLYHQIDLFLVGRAAFESSAAGRMRGVQWRHGPWRLCACAECDDVTVPSGCAHAQSAMTSRADVTGPGGCAHARRWRHEPFYCEGRGLSSLAIVFFFVCCCCFVWLLFDCTFARMDLPDGWIVSLRSPDVFCFFFGFCLFCFNPQTTRMKVTRTEALEMPFYTNRLYAN